MQHLPRHLIIPFARAGYAARGLIYLVIGIFAIGAAFWSFEKKDTKGAVLEVLQLPLGMALIIALLIGLAGYVGWRLEGLRAAVCCRSGWRVSKTPAVTLQATGYRHPGWQRRRTSLVQGHSLFR